MLACQFCGFVARTAHPRLGLLCGADQLIAVAVILLFFTIDFFDNRVGLRFGCDLMQVRCT